MTAFYLLFKNNFYVDVRNMITVTPKGAYKIAETPV